MHYVLYVWFILNGQVIGHSDPSPPMTYEGCHAMADAVKAGYAGTAFDRVVTYCAYTP